MSADEPATDGACGTFTSDDSDSTGNATGNQKPGGETVAGSPANNQLTNATYSTQRHNFMVRDASPETSPSSGWRAVYYDMEVELDGHR